MSSLSFSCRLLAVAATAVLATQAHAATGRSLSAPTGEPSGTVSAFIDVNLAGMQTFGDFRDPANSSISRSITPGSTVTGYDYLNLQFTTSGESWLAEFVLSVSKPDLTAFMDAAPSDIFNGGVFGPASGSWATAPFSEGGAFSVADGALRIFVYELATDAGVNATVNSGTLRIYYTAPVPEPATYGLMGLGLLGVAAAARRRRTND